MKGDRVEIVVDTGDGSRTYEIVATRAGRRVEGHIARGVVEVSEITRTGTLVRTARFMAGRTLALVEYPADKGPHPDEKMRKCRQFLALTRRIGRLKRIPQVAHMRSWHADPRRCPSPPNASTYTQP